MIMKAPFSPTRRDLLRFGSLAMFGAAVRGATFPLSSMADAVILIHLKGGPSHLDTLDMKPNAPVEERGEFKPIATKLSGVTVCEHLPKLAACLDRFALLRGISHSAGAHPQADEYLFTGNRPSAAVVYPSIGSISLKERPGRADMPGFVAVPNSDMGPGFLGVAFSAFKTTAVPKPGKPFEVRGLSLGGLTLEQIRNRDRLLVDLDTALRGAEKVSPVVEGMNRFSHAAAEMILSSKAREAFDTGKEFASITKLFPMHDLGQSLLLAARLVEHGVRFVIVTHDGWDTHLNNFTGHKKLLGELDGALPALIESLTQKGLLKRTLVLAAGEFGRTPTINKNAGRDHWPRASWALFAGGGVKPGQTIGGTDDKGHSPDSDTKLAPDDLAATTLHAMGVNPKHEYLTPSGRPVTLVAHGRVIKELMVDG
ncbi:MAG: DUF1501 domain-containing protein [Planctomycetes bacterium]|nr:DUF1501 domain-containing protein [Planctomycetota bacterium]